MRLKIAGRTFLLSFKRVSLPVLSTALACNACAQQAHSAQEHIRESEDGLGPPVVVIGRQPAHKNLLAEMQRLHVPAISIAVVHSGKIEWAKGYGISQEGGTPVTPSTLFQAASISKSVTASGALRLVESGKLSLDAPIQTELKNWTLPENSFTAAHPVTLRDLLSHTAGTSVYGFAGYKAGEPHPDTQADS